MGLCGFAEGVAFDQFAELLRGRGFTLGGFVSLGSELCDNVFRLRRFVTFDEAECLAEFLGERVGRVLRCLLLRFGAVGGVFGAETFDLVGPGFGERVEAASRPVASVVLADSVAVVSVAEVSVAVVASVAVVSTVSAVSVAVALSVVSGMVVSSWDSRFARRAGMKNAPRQGCCGAAFFWVLGVTWAAIWPSVTNRPVCLV
ncbi:hypothetical protein ACFQ6H_27250 [Rhodococcus sp. NPDC056506]|uniref:hypothetical protein n=1 Tax=Rhodococcus sp. NPDC056506 TaxID=3345844 RepID=UPI00366FF259